MDFNPRLYFFGSSSRIKSVATGDRNQSEPSTSSSVEWSQPCHHFEFFKIQEATKNFDDSLVIGSGGFGKVYKGYVFNRSNLVAAAIKRLDSMSTQGADEFWAEVEMLSMVRHGNLVSLIGYCNYKTEKILVYEYLPNGTLEDHLHKLHTRLSWIQRLKICIDAGRGLHYLHTGTGLGSGVIHRDVKTSNILLNDNWAAKVSDFGLSRIGRKGDTGVKGTIGYLDLDYVNSGRVTRRSDVYAFGVVLLEVLCRKHAVYKTQTIGGEEWINLAIWSQEHFKEGKLKHVIDSDIRGEISPKCLKKFVQIVERCLNFNPKQRPTMADVVDSLQSVLTLQASRGTMLSKMLDMHLFSSSLLNSGQRDSKLSGKTKANNRNHVKKAPRDIKVLPHPNLRVFSLATRKFRCDTDVDEGDLGSVYKGWLKDKANSEPNVIAVKKLSFVSSLAFQEWQAEVHFLGRLCHPNLVKLFGYRREDEKLLLGVS